MKKGDIQVGTEVAIVGRREWWSFPPSGVTRAVVLERGGWTEVDSYYGRERRPVPVEIDGHRVELYGVSRVEGDGKAVLLRVLDRETGEPKFRRVGDDEALVPHVCVERRAALIPWQEAKERCDEQHRLDVERARRQADIEQRVRDAKAALGIEMRRIRRDHLDDYTPMIEVKLSELEKLIERLNNE